MAKKSSNITKSVCFIPMNCVVVCCKGLLKKLGPKAIDFCESFSNQAIEFTVGTFLRAALNHHGTQFMLQAFRKSNLIRTLVSAGLLQIMDVPESYLHKFVTTFFKVN